MKRNVHHSCVSRHCGNVSRRSAFFLISCASALLSLPAIGAAFERPEGVLIRGRQPTSVTHSLRVQRALDRANELQRAGKPRAALATLREARDLDPRDPATYELEARFLRQSGDPQQLVVALIAALASAPNSARLQHEFGMLLIEAGEARRGIEAMERATWVEPRNHQYLQDLASQLFARNDRQDARRVLERGLGRVPLNRGLLVTLAELCESDQDWKSAVLYYDLAADNFPSGFRKHRRRARCRYFLGDYKGAVEDYQVVAKLRKNPLAIEESICHADSLMLLKHYDRAADVLARLSVPDGGNDLDVQMLRVLCAVQLGRLNKAEGLLSAALRRHPENAELKQLRLLLGALAGRGLASRPN